MSKMAQVVQRETNKIKKGKKVMVDGEKARYAQLVQEYRELVKKLTENRATRAEIRKARKK